MRLENRHTIGRPPYTAAPVVAGDTALVRAETVRASCNRNAREESLTFTRVESVLREESTCEMSYVRERGVRQTRHCAAIVKRPMASAVLS